ncbi:hypothetical protein OPV22_017520 [Ensete ventricosum]|uniref:Uncharacterized protein n=1 Tax=Ensete ventricosum TaxID=4639 RepID=A0AAV8PFA9_ENSVE|nr:hypothetical protein OPV22_017520 [Ensete ventricosum]
MNWISRKIHLYNVTMGLYMLDWWERCLFNILILVLLWFIFYNGSKSVTEFYDSFLKPKFNAYNSVAEGKIPS